MNDIQFTDREIRAIGVLVENLRHYCREDFIGAILYTGAFHCLDNLDKEAVVNLADKLKTAYQLAQQEESEYFGEKRKKFLLARGIDPETGEFLEKE